MTGANVDQAVSELVLETVTPMALEVALSVQQELQQRSEETDKIRRRQVDRAQYEADLAQRRYMQVDPDNRLVAESLEAKWNEKFVALEKVKEEYERLRQEDRLVLDEQKRKEILALATDFPRLWSNPKISYRERKRMIGLLIEDVTLLVGKRDVTAHVRFKGGATRTLTVAKPLPAWKAKQTSPELVSEIDRLLDHHREGQIATILDERGFRTGTGLRLNAERVRDIQRKYGLKSWYERLRAKGMLTVEEVADRLGVYVGTARVWQKKGLLVRNEYSKNKFLYEPPADIRLYRKFKHFENRPQRTEFGDNQQRDGREVQYEG